MIRRTAIYPGMFDPLTLGHLDVIQRGAAMFDRLIVAVGENTEKHAYFTANERVEMIQEVTRDITNVEVASFTGLAVNYARQNDAEFILRGIRTVSDMEYEFKMSLTNQSLAPEIETVFLMSKQEYDHLSSRLIREVAVLGGDVGAFLPMPVVERLKMKLAEESS